MTDNKQQTNSPHIEIVPVAQFQDKKSNPEQQQFAFSYTITIINHSDVSVQLLSRHWVITDDNQQVQEVQGMGVVGEQPHIAAGERYHYSSGAMLATEFGTMQGRYQMLDAEGKCFDVDIPMFVLIPPHAIH